MALSIEELIDGAKSPLEVQWRVSNAITYVKHCRDTIFGNEDGEYLTSLNDILEKRVGNCTEGMCVLATALDALGYETIPIIIDPFPEEKNILESHAMCLFKDKDSGEYGAVGLSPGEYHSPISDSKLGAAVTVASAIGYAKFRIIFTDLNLDAFRRGDHIRLHDLYYAENKKIEMWPVDLSRKENHPLQLTMPTRTGKANIVQSENKITVDWNGLEQLNLKHWRSGHFKAIEFRANSDNKIFPMHINLYFREPLADKQYLCALSHDANNSLKITEIQLFEKNLVTRDITRKGYSNPSKRMKTILMQPISRFHKNFYLPAISALEEHCKQN